MIRNSDDESDASLEDIDELLDDGRQMGQSSPRTARHLSSPRDVASNRTKHLTREAVEGRNPLSKRQSDSHVIPKRYKFSLDTLIKQRKTDDVSRDEMARAKLLLKSYNDRVPSEGDDKRIFDTSRIESVMEEHKDHDNISKLNSAIQRTEALQHTTKSWSFFDGNIKHVSLQKPNFPTVQDQRLRQLIGKFQSCEQMFLSGIASEYADKVGLPEEVLVWIMKALCTEPRDDLRCSYSLTLKLAAEDLSPFITPSFIDTLFQRLGANSTALDLRSAIVPHDAMSQRAEQVARPNLLSLLGLLGSVAGDLVVESRIHLLKVLCRLALDHSISANYHAISKIREVLASLIEPSYQEDLQCEVSDFFGNEEVLGQPHSIGDDRHISYYR